MDMRANIPTAPNCSHLASRPFSWGKASRLSRGKQLKSFPRGNSHFPRGTASVRRRNSSFPWGSTSDSCIRSLSVSQRSHRPNAHRGAFPVEPALSPSIQLSLGNRRLSLANHRLSLGNRRISMGKQQPSLRKASISAHHLTACSDGCRSRATNSQIPTSRARARKSGATPDMSRAASRSTFSWRRGRT